MIKLGQTGRDVVSGFVGLVMGTAQYLTGCNQVLLTPRELDKDGKRRDGEWFDEQRIVAEPNPVLAFAGGAAVETPGLDERQAPTK